MDFKALGEIQKQLLLLLISKKLLIVSSPSPNSKTTFVTVNPKAKSIVEKYYKFKNNFCYC